MDQGMKVRTAALVYRYLVVRAWFRGGQLPRTSNSQRVTPETLAQDLEQGRRLLADGVLVYPPASPPIVGDDLDPDFLAAMLGRDDAIQLEADQLEKLRRYVLEGGDLLHKHRRQQQSG